MNELKKIILNHIYKYPKMEVTDIIKLVYQNEFGGGHLISNPENSLRYLKKECDELTFFNDEEYDDIGNGLIRYNLSFLKNDEAKIVNLNEIFVKSANSHKGSLSSFFKKIELVKEMCNDNLLPFSSKELNEYLLEYEKANYPMVSHSFIYKENYHPSYRVIKKDFLLTIKF